MAVPVQISSMAGLMPIFLTGGAGADLFIYNSRLDSYRNYT
ncbi:hypothetical protein Pgy4_30741, partial [Pseudomonas savastanoi pv. glycinea str. race 4]